MHYLGVAAFDKQRFVTVACEEIADLIVAHSAEHRGIGDFVAIEMKDRKHRAVLRGIEEFVGMPGGGERPGLGFAVADHAGDDKVWIVESSAIGMHQRVAEFAALMNRSRRFRSRVARDAAGKRELAE